MIGIFQIRKDSTAPWFEIVLTQSGRPVLYETPLGDCQSLQAGVDTPIDLTDKTVTARMWGCGRTQPEVALTGTVEIVDATAGLIRYKWGASDTSVAGFFMMSFRIEDPESGTVMLWPYLKEQLTFEVTP